MRFIPDTGEFSARCRGCHELDLTLTDLQLPDALRGVNGRKAALNRLLAWNHTYVTDALAGRPVSCPGCRHVAQAAVERREHGSPQEQGDSLRVRGHACGVDYNWELPGIALTLPEGRKFWKKHPRIRALPSYGVDADGTASLVTRFESVTDSASLEAVFALDTLRVLGVYGPATHVADDD